MQTATCSVDPVRAVLEQDDGFGAITFENDSAPLPIELVTTVRTLCSAPLVLFENSTLDGGESGFDLIIPNLTPPADWLRRLHDLLDTSKRLQAMSQILRGECGDVRATARALRKRSARNRVDPIDVNRIWRGERDGK